MATLTDFLEGEALEHLAATFSSAAGVPVCILAPDGQVLAGGAGESPDSARTRILVAGEHVGTIAAAAGAHEAEALRTMGLMRDVLARLCEQAAQLRDRVEELAAMYRLTQDFTGRMDPTEVYPLAAETMVKATGADACSIRTLNEERTELLVMAASGLSDDYMSKGPILLADSEIDREVLEAGKPVYIADERTDPRVLYKAEARREGIVSALCAPMTCHGQIEGIVRVYTKRPHEFDWFESSLIQGVAAQAASAIVNARLYAEAVNAENMRRQLRLAGEVQRRMIPPAAPSIRGLDIAAIYEPCFELGGDFYDFIELPDDNLGVCVADVVGKGVRASLLMASTRSALRAHASHTYSLSAVLSAVNEHMIRDSEERDFVTLFYGVLDIPKRRLTYCCAGHEPGMLIRGGEARMLRSGGGVVGMDASVAYGHEWIDLQSGDALILFTDGLPEALNFEDDPFGRERVRQAALAEVGRGGSAEAVARHLLWEMRRFTGLHAQRDDLTMVVIRVQ